ncbi:hypothetical protein F2Q69_00048465 [Brassica cretica]|uniref:Uncharacterized protein n=1 Tax=Brassica cretica TaxID=69181 RepID=A0A8S9Q462_BRACR|nr:hypothetical protein F2Q69_00048465 [Brassica cretica]
MSVSLSSAVAPPSLFRKIFNGGWGEADSYSKENYTSELPEFSVVSNVFKKKQDSEQSTAELALKKFLSADHPLGSHLRETLQRDGECHGSVALSVITAFDIKINNCYKVINNRYKVINPSVS